MKRALFAGAGVATLTLGACDFPTAPPRIQTRLVFPAQSTTLSVDELLPGSVTVAGNAFQLTIAAPAPFQRSLAQICAICAASAGFTLPVKPAFTDSFAVTVVMPGDVSSVVVSSGSVAVTVSHNFGFDPLRPPGATSDGRLTLTARNGTRVVGTAQIDPPFPSGTPVTRVIPLAPGTITGNVVVSVTMTSPQGGPVTVGPNPSLSVSVVPGQILISEATVVVQNRAVEIDSVEVELSGVDESLAERVKGGVFIVETENPFNVTGSLVLRITGGTMPITKTLPIRAGSAKEQIQLSEQEMKAILGQDVVFTASGVINAPAGVTVRPGQVITINLKLGLLLEIGGSEESQ